MEPTQRRVSQRDVCRAPAACRRSPALGPQSRRVSTFLPPEGFVDPVHSLCVVGRNLWVCTGSSTAPGTVVVYDMDTGAVKVKVSRADPTQVHGTQAPHAHMREHRQSARCTCLGALCLPGGPDASSACLA